jgi:subtilisin family serine protease
MRLSLLTALATTVLTAPSPAPVEDPVVAVIDTGVDLAAPAFAGRAWVNPREIPGNGLDDDRDGLVDDVNGWNYDAGTASLADPDGHGTAVAGLIAGQDARGRPYGVAGVGRIMALPVGTRPHTLAIFPAIRYAVVHGARIVNASFTGSLGAADGAIQASPGVLFVAGAGNDSADIDVTPSAYWPCTSTAPNVICVAAAGRRGDPARFTNRGVVSVDLAAPATGLRTAGRGRFTGTSAAAAVVSGAIAYLWSLAPEASAAEVRAALLSSAEPRASWAGRTVTGGVLDVPAAAAALTRGPVVALPLSRNAGAFERRPGPSPPRHKRRELRRNLR